MLSSTSLCTEIDTYLLEVSKDREDRNANRASSAPQCVRKRWFKNQGIKGEPLSARSLRVFSHGDLVEHEAKYLIAQACVGPDKTYSEVDFGEKVGTFVVQHREYDIYKQETLYIKIPGLPDITAHPDGFGKRNSDGRWEVIEVKSSSTIGFGKFVKGETPDYIKQVHTIMMSSKAKELGADTARFFYYDKNISEIFDRLYPYNPALAYSIAQEFKIAASSTDPGIPKDEPNIGPELEKATSKMKLGYKCSYCDYKQKCFNNIKVAYKSNRPVFYLQGV